MTAHVQKKKVFTKQEIWNDHAHIKVVAGRRVIFYKILKKLYTLHAAFRESS